MILSLLHDRRSLAEVANLKRAIEDLYGIYGLQVHDHGYFHVPFKEQRLDASRLMRYMTEALSMEMCLLIVDESLYYPGKGDVFGCSAGKQAIISRHNMDLDQALLAKEAIHEVGHLLGLDHCSEYCVMNLSRSKKDLGKKPSSLCSGCSSRLLALAKD